VLSEGVSAVESACFAEERCDALDSDCDGRIDEGCTGEAPGGLQIGLAWSGAAALALELTPSTPSTETAPAADGCEGLGPHFEHLAVEEPSGAYQISVRREHPCEDDQPTAASVTVAVGGERLGTFNVTVGEETAQVVSFSVGR